MKPLFNKVAIIGVGLIGGSLAKDIKRKKLAREVIGVTRRPKTLKQALSLKVIDRGTLSIKEALKGADLIILATPVVTILKAAPLIIKSAKRGAVIIDVGSTKLEIVKSIEKVLPEYLYFVGTHPLAGSEKSGVVNAQSGLFKNSLCVVTPTSKTNRYALKKIIRLWNKLGARVKFLSPARHDRIIASISHLPHIVAFSLIDAIPATYLDFAASGLRDATRLADSDARMWRDICLSNKKEIVKSIHRMERSLSHLKTLIAKGSSRSLFRQFQKIKVKHQLLKV